MRGAGWHTIKDYFTATDQDRTIKCIEGLLA